MAPLTAASLLLAGLVGGCSVGSSRESILPSSRSVPLRTVEFSGHRYVVPVDFDSIGDVPLMVHGNSRLYASLTHRVGERLIGGPVPKVEDYGYSTKGKGVIRVSRIRIAGRTFAGDSAVPVFDFSEDGDTPVQGMVGVPFLLAAKAAVDFAGDRLLLGVAVSREPNRSLLASGYRWTPVAVHPGGRVTVDATFPGLRRVVRITPSTVSSGLTLHLPLFADAIPMRKSPSPDRSPSGTTPDEFTADSVAFEIAGVSMRSPASFEDFAEYSNVSEDELETFGMLGFDWMKEHQAVLDYANRRLYFRP